MMKVLRIPSLFWICGTMIFKFLDTQTVSSEGQLLFASLGQLELLWQNDIAVVKAMEILLMEKLSEYRPLKRY